MLLLLLMPPACDRAWVRLWRRLQYCFTTASSHPHGRGLAMQLQMLTRTVMMTWRSCAYRMSQQFSELYSMSQRQQLQYRAVH